MKYLIRWKLPLGRKELEILSSQPRLLQPGLDYVKDLMSEGKVIGVYRIVREKPIRGRVTYVARQPSGIAIVEAESLEEVKKLVEGVPGLTSEGVRGLTYLEYEIDPLEELAREEEM